jgi:hypothetical protein
MNVYLPNNTTTNVDNSNQFKGITINQYFIQIPAAVAIVLFGKQTFM